MNKFIPNPLVLLFMASLLLSCQALSNNSKPTVLPVSAENKFCPILPSNFKETDLLGSWVANYHLSDKDTLIIRNDGLYKQIYENPNAGLRYESEWHEWWIEYRDSGYIRLHFNKMRRCDDITLFCQREEGGIDPDVIWAIDYCEDEEVTMPDKVVLIVTGAKYDTPRGIILRQTRLAGAETTNSFRLVSEETTP